MTNPKRLTVMLAAALAMAAAASGARACAYNDVGYWGDYVAFVMKNGTRGNVPDRWNNKISSVRPC